VLGGLSDIQKRKLRVADNKIATSSGWDNDKLIVELEDFIALPDFDPAAIGFNAPEIDLIFSDHEVRAGDPADVAPEIEARRVTVRGDSGCLASTGSSVVMPGARKTSSA
jgi:hypothetical protein